MKIHVLGLPHTVTNRDYSTCAFTQKALKLCSMMTRLGHQVIHYGCEGATVEAEHVTIMGAKEQETVFPHPGTNYYPHDRTDPVALLYKNNWMNSLRRALHARTSEPHTEIICQTWGGPQREACEGIEQLICESGIGYPVSWARYRIYESYTWMHMHLGAAGHWDGGKWSWCVIPNSFDLSDFPGQEPVTNNRKEFLYFGRLNADKGVGLAVEVTKAIGAKLTIVGQGNPEKFMAPHVTYLPPVGPKERSKLLGQARAVFCPTTYIEPFCGVSVEAQLCGTPVITTDWGAFSETVVHGVTGYRCRSFREFVTAAEHVGDLSPNACRSWAENNYSLERVAPMYEEVFDRWLSGGDSLYGNHKTNDLKGLERHSC
jgi:glycosyltransferase involved in cell wall biosynthesis